MGKLYSIPEVARFFGKTPGWIYWGFSNGKFVYEDGTEISPSRMKSTHRGKLFDLDTIQEIALSCYRNRTLDDEGFREVLSKILAERESDE